MLIFSSLLLFIFTSLHLYIFTSVHLYTTTFLHIYIFASSHLCIFTSLHLHIVASSYPGARMHFWRRSTPDRINCGRSHSPISGNHAYNHHRHHHHPNHPHHSRRPQASAPGVVAPGLVVAVVVGFLNVLEMCFRCAPPRPHSATQRKKEQPFLFDNILDSRAMCTAFSIVRNAISMKLAFDE